MYKYEMESGKVSKLTETPKVAEKGYSLSEDGSKIALEIYSDIPFRSQLFVYDIKAANFQQITKGEVPIESPIWSKNGKKIAGVRSSDGQNGELLVYNFENSKMDTRKPPTITNIYYPMTFSPDDSAILCLSKNEKGFGQMTLIDAATYEAKKIGPGDWDVNETIWNKKSGIYFTKNVSGRFGIYHMQTPRSPVEEIFAPSGTISGLTINKGENKLLFTKQDATHPIEICTRDLKTNKIEYLTNSMPIGIEPARLSEAEPFNVKSYDNTQIQGFVYKPKGDLDKNLPAVLVVHGGPSGQDVDNFSTMT
jgi:dipeptidyl aminopeptidase/acylaminoacyl peptidase